MPTEGRRVTRATRLNLSIHEIGDSQGPAIPKNWREELDIKRGDSATAEVDFEERSVTFYF